MPRSRDFILLLFLFLFPGVSTYCYMSTAEECSKVTASVPGHHLVREGIDITTLSATGTYLVDTDLRVSPNGTCTLCRNPLQGQVQRAPLAVVDWKVNVLCNQDISSSVEESAVGAARVKAADVTNDWKKDLVLPGEPRLQAVQGTQSRLTNYAYEKEQQDRHMFVLQELSCVYYSMRVRPDPPLMPDFSWAVSQLPPVYESTTYRQFLTRFGTHYMSQAVLGGRVRKLSAIPTCRAVLDGLTTTEIQQRLVSQFRQELGLAQSLSSPHDYEQSSQDSWSSQAPYMDGNAEVTGGHGHGNLLSATKQDPAALSSWMESLKGSPGLVSYSLAPIHTLLGSANPRREALRQAVKEYVLERGQRKCPRRCPQGGRADPLDPCKCHCSGDPLINSKCCSLQRGTARLKVRVLSGQDLKGDLMSPSDPYVSVFFQGLKLQTSLITDNDNPVWMEDLDFGAVKLWSKPELKVEVWDSDAWPLKDQLLGSCQIPLKVGRNVLLTCAFSSSLVTYSYLLECGPNLGGDVCQEYMPVRG
ncbi:perforin-1-like [Carettochelys insculpta]|uniref:perforin-1-like n=1 Tax=Carettochelys insculpta TaxID=44489 RepID=UPI003EB8980B